MQMTVRDEPSASHVPEHGIHPPLRPSSTGIEARVLGRPPYVSHLQGAGCATVQTLKQASKAEKAKPKQMTLAM
jgi:hypothetical protein